jgi:hypothetical protein
MQNVNLSRKRTDTVHALLCDVDEFLAYIAVVKTPDMDAVRGRLVRLLRSARHQLIAAGRSPMGPSIQGWRTAIAAVALGGLVAAVVGLSRSRGAPRG